MDWALAPLAMGPRSRPMFMYGTFLGTQKLRTQAFFGAASEPPGALEVFREFSAPELMGTPHTMPLTGHRTIAPQFIVFRTDGAGPCEVLRFEVRDFKVAGDESGIAVYAPWFCDNWGTMKPQLITNFPGSPSRPDE
jgi:hypothetical protein